MHPSVTPTHLHACCLLPAAYCLLPALLQCLNQHTTENLNLLLTIQDLTDREASLKALLAQKQQELCEQEAKHSRLEGKHTKVLRSYQHLTEQLRTEQVSFAGAGKLVQTLAAAGVSMRLSLP